MSNISHAIIFNETKQVRQTVILGFHCHTIKNKNANHSIQTVQNLQYTELLVTFLTALNIFSIF